MQTAAIEKGNVANDVKMRLRGSATSRMGTRSDYRRVRQLIIERISAKAPTIINAEERLVRVPVRDQLHVHGPSTRTSGGDLEERTTR